MGFIEHVKLLVTGSPYKFTGVLWSLSEHVSTYTLPVLAVKLLS